ncbi:MAG: L,D-transpeptidase [Luteolibacter sp.]|jgi:lipoprotein-anchoring transpeptidase ErfK/SrfK
MGKRAMIETGKYAIRMVAASAIGVMCFSSAACMAPRVTPPADLYEAYQVKARQPRDRSAVRIKVSLGEQRAYVMEGERMLMVMPVTVGRVENPTPEGEFRITRKIERHRSPDYGFAVRGTEVKRARVSEVPAGWRYVGMPLPYWCEIAPGVGFHTGWLRHQPASQRTIRMHHNVAPLFYAMVDVGTPVSIAYAHPEDGKHAFISLPPDSGPLPPYPDAFYLGDGFFEK